MTSKQIDRLIDVLDRAVKAAERWADREYPETDETTEATISRVGERTHPQTIEEYNAFEPEEVALSRLARRLNPQA